MGGNFERACQNPPQQGIIKKSLSSEGFQLQSQLIFGKTSQFKVSTLLYGLPYLNYSGQLSPISIEVEKRMAWKCGCRWNLRFASWSIIHCMQPRPLGIFHHNHRSLLEIIHAVCLFVYYKNHAALHLDASRMHAYYSHTWLLTSHPYTYIHLTPVKYIFCWLIY